MLSYVKVEHWMSREVLTSYHSQPNSECHILKHGRQTVCANIHGQEGNNPDRSLRSLNCC